MECCKWCLFSRPYSKVLSADAEACVSVIQPPPQPLWSCVPSYPAVSPCYRPPSITTAPWLVVQTNTRSSVHSHFSSVAADTPVSVSSPVNDRTCTHLLIPSINSLISELPPITDLLDFCLCLQVQYSYCQQILTDHQGNTRRQETEVAAKWYTQSTEPSGDKVIAALFCHQNNQAAVQLRR